MTRRQSDWIFCRFFGLFGFLYNDTMKGDAMHAAELSDANLVYSVQPAVLKSKRDALNAKLKDAGKPPMK